MIALICSSNFDMTSSNNLPPPIDREFFHSNSTTSKTSSRELKTFRTLIGQDENKRSRPNQHRSRIPRSLKQFSSGHDNGSQQVHAVDGLTNENQQFIEVVRRIQIRARQEINSRKTGWAILGQ
jgi:hypothetical protein